MELDGKKLLEQLMYGIMVNGANSDPNMAKIISVFKKYNIGIVDAIAIILELGFILQEPKGEE